LSKFLELAPLAVAGRSILVVRVQLAATSEMGLVVADQVFLEDCDVTPSGSKIKMSE
jgi:hypothetical protein